MTTAHDFTLQHLITGAEQPLSAFAGKAILVVNVASACGLTPQYRGLQALHDRYADKGLVVVGVPCNQFGAQEPGTAEEIQQFCSTKYDVTFPMMRRVDVNGASAHPLFQWLTNNGAAPIAWNFNKFLIGKDGSVAKRFEPTVAPEAAEVVAAIDAALG
jgi:glutathione peroxidase